MPENALRGWHLKQHLARSSSPCPERVDLDQSTPAGLLSCQQMCTRCGRVTARRDGTGLPWCGGVPITAAARTAEIAPGRWRTSSGPLAVTP